MARRKRSCYYIHIMNVSTDEVKKPAALSRIELTDDEVESMRGDIESILSYVDTIQQVKLPDGVAPSPHLELTNVMRDDVSPHEPGMYTEKILQQAPKRKENYLQVKKILG